MLWEVNVTLVFKTALQTFIMSSTKGSTVASYKMYLSQETKLWIVSATAEFKLILQISTPILNLCPEQVISLGFSHHEV